MTDKELLYIEDALGHECFLKTSTQCTSKQLNDARLANYLEQLQQKHCGIFNNFMKLL